MENILCYVIQNGKVLKTKRTETFSLRTAIQLITVNIG